MSKFSSKFSFSKLSKIFKKPSFWILSCVLVVAIIGASIGFNYLSLATNCNGKNLEAGFGEGILEAQVLKEANIEAKYYVNKTDFDIREDNLLGFGIATKPSLTDSLKAFFPNGNCVINPLDYNKEIIFDNNFRITSEINTRMLVNFPSSINLWQQKRIYNLQGNLKNGVENILKDYKLYKYGKTWVVQGDSPSMKKNR